MDTKVEYPLIVEDLPIYQFVKEKKQKRKSPEKEEPKLVEEKEEDFIDEEFYKEDYITLMAEALKKREGYGTGKDILDWICDHYLIKDKKKLSYTINGILSSSKYKNIFFRQKGSQRGERAVWKLNSFFPVNSLEVKKE